MPLCRGLGPDCRQPRHIFSEKGQRVGKAHDVENFPDDGPHSRQRHFVTGCRHFLLGRQNDPQSRRRNVIHRGQVKDQFRHAVQRDRGGQFRRGDRVDAALRTEGQFAVFQFSGDLHDVFAPIALVDELVPSEKPGEETRFAHDFVPDVSEGQLRLVGMRRQQAADVDKDFEKRLRRGAVVAAGRIVYGHAQPGLPVQNLHIHEGLGGGIVLPDIDLFKRHAVLPGFPDVALIEETRHVVGDDVPGLVQIGIGAVPCASGNEAKSGGLYAAYSFVQNLGFAAS